MTDFTGGTWRSLVDGSEVSAIPDYAVDYRYLSESFASPWPDETDTVDMSVSGLTESTFAYGETSVLGDGSSDHGTADGPQNLPEGDPQIGIAFTIQIDTSPDARDAYAGSEGSNGSRLQLYSRDAGGEITASFRDDTGSQIDTQTDSTYADGEPHAVVINKSGDDPASDIEIFVDDMSTSANTSVPVNQGYSNSNYSNGEPLAFYAFSDVGSITNNTNIHIGAIEFKSDPYSQSDREAFVDWRPEV